MLRFYSIGSLDELDMIRYLRTHALMYEYYRQAQEIVPPQISKVLHRLFTSEAYQIVNSRYNMRSYYIFSFLQFLYSLLTLIKLIIFLCIFQYRSNPGKRCNRGRHTKRTSLFWRISQIYEDTKWSIGYANWRSMWLMLLLILPLLYIYIYIY